MDKTGDVLDGRYELKECLSEGKQRNVWVSYDVLLERSVVIKFFNQQTTFVGDINWGAVYAREARIVARLEHPHIFPVYDLGTKDGQVYSVMRLIPSQPIGDYVSQNKIPVMLVLRIAQLLANAIDYLHSKNIIHGDLTDRNILLDSQQNPYISNLVIHSMIQQAPEDDYIRRRNATYSAPEILEGKLLEKGMDIFSFEMILFLCFGGKSYVIAEQAYSEQLLKDSDVLLPSIRKYRPELPIGIDLVLRRLCAKNPEDRYQTATEAVDDLYRVFYSGQGDIEGKVFISYATKDKDYVHKLAAELRGVGVDIWIDQDIEQGSDWGDSIENALKACDMMLLITTEASMDSAYVSHEWSYFMGLGKPVYPFVPDTKLPENIHPRLNRLQLVQGTGDMLADIQNVVTVLAGGNPKKLAGLDK